MRFLKKYLIEPVPERCDSGMIRVQQRSDRAGVDRSFAMLHTVDYLPLCSGGRYIMIMLSSCGGD